ncbi:MAG TPA: Gfo/Idh/MocA family oxidoreductase [Solirubrobacterales bacterium]
MKLAIAGCGRISQVGYAPALRQVAGAELCAVADPDPGRRDRLAASAPGEARAYESVAAMLDGSSPDAIVIASPPARHAEQAELASAAGIPALVEKPPGRDAGEAERLAELDPPVWVGFNRRFSHLTAVAPRVPASGELELSLRLCYRRGSWRAHEVSEDALGDLGPHLADLAACLLGGELRSARARSIEPDRARIELTGDRGSARVVCRTDSAWAERVEVRRSSGELSARSVHGGVARSTFARLRGGEHPLVTSLARQLRALAGVVRGEGGGMLATAREGVTAMRALDAARASAMDGGEVVRL